MRRLRFLSATLISLAGLVWLAGCDGKADTGRAPDPTASVASTASNAAGTTSVAAAPSVTAESEPAVPGNVPDAVDGANVTMGATTVDDLEMEKVSCKCGAGALGSLGILGALAKKRADLVACTKSAEAVRVHFAFSEGKTSDVRVAGASSPGAAKCVADAVSAAAFPDAGSCALTLKLPGGGTK